MGVAYLLPAELPRVANEFEQDVVCLSRRGKESVESEAGVED